MNNIVRRGFSPKDKEEFGYESIQILHKAAKDLYYLINQGYNIKGASTFIGNHYLLSERQRLALVRAISSENSVKVRKEKEVLGSLENSTVHIDGFNTIITLEVLLSESLVLRCLDGTIRDLAGLRGTYRLIDKTDIAINLIGNIISKHKITEANFYLDAPVSNSGRLKERILELLKVYNFEVNVQNINNVDKTLEGLPNVITSDAIILDKCESWINLNREIVENENSNYWIIDFKSLESIG
ncbi:DUF434 domain-containing protein [Clostridium sp. 'White wine YQ']|uniref:DUF434 domain-containing protein n=1 Tax=Clostridium sp. 'White wine YQ' TaxID=3027474 RepID=UPI002365D353|nr:DUF434 domain-containing protein [Clostridium sp. 'White wine YQ']MDD7793340.1 DUF434 domain-containing protein [Clostridium sp. 'White wine YQ']